MTALDPAPIVRELEEEFANFGQYRPETVRRLIEVTRSTGDLPRPLPFPSRPVPVYPPPHRAQVPCGRRSLAPGIVNARSASVVAIYPRVCGERRDPALGCSSLVCTEPADHAPLDHLAHGESGRVLGRWSCTRPRGRT